MKAVVEVLVGATKPGHIPCPDSARGVGEQFRPGIRGVRALGPTFPKLALRSQDAVDRRPLLQPVDDDYSCQPGTGETLAVRRPPVGHRRSGTAA